MHLACIFLLKRKFLTFVERLKSLTLKILYFLQRVLFLLLLVLLINACQSDKHDSKEEKEPGPAFYKKPHTNEDTIQV